MVGILQIVPVQQQEHVVMVESLLEIFVLHISDQIVHGLEMFASIVLQLLHAHSILVVLLMLARIFSIDKEDNADLLWVRLIVQITNALKFHNNYL